MNLKHQAMVAVENNLNECINQSGMTNNEVAAAKGVTPETLRRHKNGKIQMTINDAERYAQILGVEVQRILFHSKPIPVLGTCLIQENHIHRELHQEQKFEVFANGQYLKDRACFLWSCEEKYKGEWYEYDNSIQFVKYSPIVDKYIDTSSYQRISVVKTKTPMPINLKGYENETQNLVAGVLYPQPGGVYTVHNGKTNMTYKDLDLEWATPVLSVVFRPDLLGIHTVETA